MARTNNEGNLSPGRGGDGDCLDSDDDRKHNNDDHHGSNDNHGVSDDTRRKSKRHTSSTGTSAKKKQNGRLPKHQLVQNRSMATKTMQ